MVTPKKLTKAGPEPYYDKHQDRWCVTVELPPREGKRHRRTITAQTEKEIDVRFAALKRQLELARLDSIWGEARRAEHPNA